MGLRAKIISTYVMQGGCGAIAAVSAVMLLIDLYTDRMAFHLFLVCISVVLFFLNGVIRERLERARWHR